MSYLEQEEHTRRRRDVEAAVADGGGYTLLRKKWRISTEGAWQWCNDHATDEERIILAANGKLWNQRRAEAAAPDEFKHVARFLCSMSLTAGEAVIVIALLSEDRVWGAHELIAHLGRRADTTKTLHVQVNRARAKFNLAGFPDPIFSMCGKGGGYWLSDEGRARLLNSTREAGRSALNAPFPGTERPVRGEQAADAA